MLQDEAVAYFNALIPETKKREKTTKHSSYKEDQLREVKVNVNHFFKKHSIQQLHSKGRIPAFYY